MTQSRHRGKCAHAYTQIQTDTIERGAALSGQDAEQTPQEALIRARYLYRSSQHKGEPLTARNL